MIKCKQSERVCSTWLWWDRTISDDFWVSFAWIHLNSLEMLIHRQIRSSFPKRTFPPCGLPVSCCLAMSVVQSRRGPHGLPSPRIFMFLGGMKSALVLSPSPEPWRAQRLQSADVDSRVWLASTQNNITSAVPFMMWIHSGLGG